MDLKKTIQLVALLAAPKRCEEFREVMLKVLVVALDCTSTVSKWHGTDFGDVYHYHRSLGRDRHGNSYTVNVIAGVCTTSISASIGK